MNIITDIEESRLFAYHMSRSLHDAEYWRQWHLLEVVVRPELDWIKQAKITALIQPQLKDEDGTILWLEGHLIVVYENPDRLDLNILKTAIRSTIDLDEIQATVLNVAKSPDRVRELLMASQYDDVEVDMGEEASFSRLKDLVPNIEDLLMDWHKGIKSRQGRDKPHLMLVDDDPVVTRLAVKAFSSEFNIIVAANGGEAIAKHLQYMPDIIFLDIGLPDCDGITLLSYMQQYDQDVRIVMFTGDDFLKMRVKAISGGAHGFLGKPFSPKAFRQKIDEWMSGKEEAR